MEIRPLEIPAVKLIVPPRHLDARGFFSETYSAHTWRTAGLGIDFVQDNHSLSAVAGTLRGLHFQRPPYAQAKLLRVVRGSVFDVAIDIRRGSPTFGRSVTAVLSAVNWHQLFVPIGFAHGFLTLEPDTEVIYKVTASYAPRCEGGIAWNDPALKLKWPQAKDIVISEKDSQLPVLADCETPFDYDE